MYDLFMKRESERLLTLSEADKRIFYLGVTAHINLGDLGQHYCILKWIKENYPDYSLVQFEADPVVYKKHDFIRRFRKVYRPQDIIIFQSGYTTQDLGGYHNLMHEMVVEAMPDAKILMLPQTVFFQKEENVFILGVFGNGQQRYFPGTFARFFAGAGQGVLHVFKVLKKRFFPVHKKSLDILYQNLL